MTQQQIEQMRINSRRKGLTMYGEYAAGAMDASEWQRKNDIEEFIVWLKRSCDLFQGEEDENLFRKEMEKIL